MWVQGAAVLSQPLNPLFHCNPLNGNRTPLFSNSYQKPKSSVVVMSTKSTSIPIMVNSCYGKLGSSIIMAADDKGFQILPKSFGSELKDGNIEEISGIKIKVHGPNSDRESVLASLFDEHPNMIVVDYTVPAAVNANADLYCKVGVPFVMGTTGGDRDRLYKAVHDANNYAFICPQMAKEVVVFYAALKTMAEEFAGVFSGSSIHVKCPQGVKLSRSAVITLQELGFSLGDEIEMIRDPLEQLEMLGVPQGNLADHVFCLNSPPSPDSESSESGELKFNICTSSYVAGTVEAIFFLSKMIQSKIDKRIYNMIDLLQEPKGNTR